MKSNGRNGQMIAAALAMATPRHAMMRASIISAMIISAGPAASAAPITWWITGTTSTHGTPIGGPPSGTLATLAITLDPDTAAYQNPFCPPGSGRVFPAILGSTLSYSGGSVAFGPGYIEVNAGGGECTLSTLSTEFRMWAVDSDVTFARQLVALPHPTDIHAPDLYGILGGATGAGVLVMSWSGIFFGQNYFSFSGPIRSSGPLQPEPIPEPGSILLFGTGLLSGAAWLRKSRAARHS